MASNIEWNYLDWIQRVGEHNPFLIHRFIEVLSTFLCFSVSIKSLNRPNFLMIV